MKTLSRHQLKNLAEWFAILVSIPRAFEPRRVQVEALPAAIQAEFARWVGSAGRIEEYETYRDGDGGHRTCSESLYYGWLTALILGDVE